MYDSAHHSATHGALRVFPRINSRSDKNEETVETYLICLSVPTLRPQLRNYQRYRNGKPLILKLYSKELQWFRSSIDVVNNSRWKLHYGLKGCLWGSVVSLVFLSGSFRLLLMHTPSLDTSPSAWDSELCTQGTVAICRREFLTIDQLNLDFSSNKRRNNRNSSILCYYNVKVFTSNYILVMVPLCT